MLNSFWGKFGQRPNQTQVTTCTKPSQFCHLIQDDLQIIDRMNIVNEHTIEVFHTFNQDCQPIQSNLNIFIACFTTCYARIQLYKALDELQEHILYFDTDSIIYTCKQGEQMLNRGYCLGDFTSELDPNDYIREFVSAGPKNYAYVTKQGKKILHSKRLDTQLARTTNFTF